MNPKLICNRRRFLCCVAGATGAIALGATRLRARSPAKGSAESIPFDAIGESALRQARRASKAFGTTVSITAWHVDERSAADAIDAAFRELELVEELMSIYRPDSQLSRLNRTGEFTKPHPYFVEVLRASAAMSQRSAGAFDITVQPLWNLFSEAKRAGTLPTDAAIARARQSVDWRRVEVSPDRLALRGTKTQITLNGIAQGFAADRASAALRARGVAHALIDAGEIGALGGKPDGQPWSVGIQHPRHDAAFVSLARLRGRCLATSGDYATTFSSDFRFHHLFDPKTGVSPTELASVSVAAPNAMLADALSTAVFVLGAAGGLALIERTSGADALLVFKDGKVRATRGFPAV
jgi:thiamine biosynthesis lipoprotein